MNNFELTERGKIVIAVVLVVILLVIPAVIILGISSCSGSTGAPPDSNSSVPLPTQLPVFDGSPNIQNSPPPTQGDNPDTSAGAVVEPTATPELTPTPEPTATPEPTPGGGDDVVDPPEFGTVGLNIAAGTMQIIISQENQMGFDEETVDMLGDFLSSPRNTSGSLIRVEIPSLSDEDEAQLRSAVAGAFSLYNVSESRLLFAGNGSRPSEQSFEIAMSFTSISNQK